MGLDSASIICIHLIIRVFKQFLLVITLTNCSSIFCSLFSFANWFFFPQSYSYRYCYQLSNVNDIIITNVIMAIIILILNEIIVLLLVIYTHTHITYLLVIYWHFFSNGHNSASFIIPWAIAQLLAIYPQIFQLFELHVLPYLHRQSLVQRTISP